MGKLVVRVLACVLGITMCLVALIAMTNIYDPPLNPQVAQILSHKAEVNPEQRRPFYYLLGLYSSASVEDAEKVGEKLWQRFEKGEKQLLMELDSKVAFPQVSFQGCGENNVCGVAELEADPLLAQQILDNEEALKRINHLFSYGQSSQLAIATDQYWLAPQLRIVPVDQNLARLFYLQLAQWFKEGHLEHAFTLIEQSNHYMRNALLSGTELDRQLASIYMRNNAQLLKTEKERVPELILPESVIQSFQVPEASEILKAGLETELRIFASSFSQVSKVGDLAKLSIAEAPAPGATKVWWHAVPATPGLKPNETLNMYYEIQNQAANTECEHITQENELECIPARSWLKKTPWFYLRNPVGHGLAIIHSAHANKKNGRLFSRLNEVRELKETLVQ